MTSPAAAPDASNDENEAYRIAVRVGLADADAGRVTPFEPFTEWLSTWGDEDEPPPPRRPG